MKIAKDNQEKDLYIQRLQLEHQNIEKDIKDDLIAKFAKNAKIELDRQNGIHSIREEDLVNQIKILQAQLDAHKDHLINNEDMHLNNYEKIEKKFNSENELLNDTLKKRLEAEMSVMRATYEDQLEKLDSENESLKRKVQQLQNDQELLLQKMKIGLNQQLQEMKDCYEEQLEEKDRAIKKLTNGQQNRDPTATQELENQVAQLKAQIQSERQQHGIALENLGGTYFRLIVQLG